MTGFDPGRHGFRFRNDFVNQIVPEVGFTTRGLCGGMVYAALDYFHAGMPRPLQADLPADPSPLRSYIFGRQMTSLLDNHKAWLERVDPPPHFRHGEMYGWGIIQQLEALRNIIDGGTPIPLGLTAYKGLGGHQVLAIGYHMGRYQGHGGLHQDDLEIYVYDPNWPGVTRVLVPDPAPAVQGFRYRPLREQNLWIRPAVGYDITWRRIEGAEHVQAMTAIDGNLWAAMGDNTLWVREASAGKAEWRHVDHANNVTDMAATNSKLYATASNSPYLWRRDPVARRLNWERYGDGADVVGLAAIGNTLFSADRNDKLRMKDADDPGAAWTVIDHANNVTALAATGGTLFATSSDDNKLWRRDDPAARGVGWTPAGRADKVVAMAAIDCRLYAVGSSSGPAEAETLWHTYFVDGMYRPATPLVVPPLRPATPFGWEPIGHANNVTAMAATNGKLFATASNSGNLWTRDPAPREVNWGRHGPGGDIVGMAAIDGTLFAAVTDDTLRIKPADDRRAPWTTIDHANNVTAMAASGGKLFATSSNDNYLWKRDDPFARHVGWTRAGYANEVVAMTAANGKLYATASDNDDLWARDDDAPAEVPWVACGKAGHVVAMTSTDCRLFAALDDNTLVMQFLSGVEAGD